LRERFDLLALEHGLFSLMRCGELRYEPLSYLDSPPQADVESELHRNEDGDEDDDRPSEYGPGAKHPAESHHRSEYRQEPRRPDRLLQQDQEVCPEIHRSLKELLERDLRQVRHARIRHLPVFSTMVFFE